MTLLADRAEVAAARPSSGLSHLIHPIGLARFQDEYWEREPLLVQREDRDYYDGLLTLDDVDRILSLSGVQLDNLRVVLDGRETPVEKLSAGAGVNSLEALYTHYRNGSTVVLNGLDSRFEPLLRLSRALSAEVNARFQMNVYVTPAGNQGFKPHYDTHDVFVVQVHGSKRWRLSGQPYELPLKDRPYDKSQPEPEPEREFELRAGDLLYLPRGTVHSAAANDTVSVHITIGVHPVLWSELISEAARRLFAEDVRFRRGLPIGFAGDEGLRREVAATAAEVLDAFRAGFAPESMVDAAVERAVSITWPTLRHHFTDLEEVDRIGLGTMVRRRAEQQWNLTEGQDVASLAFHDKAVDFPASVAEEVRYVAETGGSAFTGADIPGDLDDAGRLVLISTLIREGFLTLG